MKFFCAVLVAVLAAVLYYGMYEMRNSYGNGDMCSGFDMPNAAILGLAPSAEDMSPEGPLCKNPKIMEDPDEYCIYGDICIAPPGHHLGYERLLIKVLKDQAEAWNRSNSSAVLKPKTVPLKRKVIFQIKDHNGVAHDWDMPVEDEDELRGTFGIYLHKFIQDFYLRSRFFCLSDIDIKWDSGDEAMAMLKLMMSGKNTLWGHIPPPLAVWEDVTSDITLSRFVFVGMPHLLIDTVDEGNVGSVEGVKFMVDMSYMRDLEVRDGFEKYGAIAYFADDATLRAIFWSHGNKLVTPNDAEWEHAKWAFRVSAMTGITLVQHLVKLHLMSANFVTDSVRRHLNTDHPLRLFMKPFTYRTISINFAASSALAGEFGLLHRATGFTYAGLTAGFTYAYKTVRAESFEHFLGRLNDPALEELQEKHGRFPCAQDAREFVHIVSTFVRGYVEEYYPTDAALLADKAVVETYDAIMIGHGDIGKGAWDIPSGVESLTGRDALIHMITYFIFQVTAEHNVVGKVSEYLADAEFTSGAIRPGRERGDVQKSMMAAAIAISTGLTQPLITNDFTHLLLRDDHFEVTKECFDTFRREMSALGDRINERNKGREWVCNHYNPHNTESSISI